MEIKDEMVFSTEWCDTNKITNKVHFINIEKVVKYLQKEGFGFDLGWGHRVVEYGMDNKSFKARIPLASKLVNIGEVKEIDGQIMLPSIGWETEYFLTTRYINKDDVGQTKSIDTLELLITNRTKPFQSLCCQIRYEYNGDEEPSMVLNNISKLKEVLVDALQKDYKGELYEL